MRVEAKRVKGYVGSVAVAGATQDADGVYVVEGDVTVTVTYTLQSAKATLTFVMKDAEGLVEGVQVALDGVANPQKTDAKGVARFEGLQLKAYSYTASKEGYKDAKGVVKLEGDATQEVTLERVATLTFVVKGEDGVVLQGAEVVVDGKKQFTDANGKAAYPGLALAEYSYTVSKEGYEAAEGKKVLEAQGSTVEVLLKRVSSPKPEPDAVESVLLSVVTLRPNPASAVLQVERAAAVETLRVVTLRGEMLLEQRNLAAASEVVVRLDGVPDGMYLLVVEGDGAQRAIPFVVTK